MRLERRLRVSRGIVGPELVDQGLARDDLVRVQQEKHEDAALAGAAEVQGPTVKPDLERSEDPEIEPRRQAATVHDRGGLVSRLSVVVIGLKPLVGSVLGA